MRAVVINSFSKQDNLELADLPVPALQPGEVLIKVNAAGVGLWDSKVRQNLFGMGEAALPFPVKMGWECSGVVTEVGSEVQGFKAGDEVLAYNDMGGTWAEYVAVPVGAVGLKPASLDFIEAGALPVSGVTAHQAITEDLKVAPGETVLITAAAGGTGLLAVQLAAQLGARVIGTASARNHALVKEVGADEVIDYSREDFVQAVQRICPGGVDAVLECADSDNFFKSIEALRPGGRAGSIVGWDKSRPIRPDISPIYIIGRPEGSRMAKMAELVAERQIKVQIQQVLPLEEISRAMELVESRHLQGKIILRI